MKTYILPLLLVFTCGISFAQAGDMLIKKDTLLLKAEESNWYFTVTNGNKAGGYPSDKISMGDFLVNAVKTGNLKAYDGMSGELIPANKIDTWKMGIDTVANYDSDSDKTMYKIIQRKINLQQLSRIRILQDWFLNSVTGKLFSKINCIELLQEVNNPIGIFIGYKIFCRIYY